MALAWTYNFIWREEVGIESLIPRRFGVDIASWSLDTTLLQNEFQSHFMFISKTSIIPHYIVR